MRKRWLNSDLKAFKDRVKHNKTQSVKYKSINLSLLKNVNRIGNNVMVNLKRQVFSESPRILYPRTVLDRTVFDSYAISSDVKCSETKENLSLSERIRKIKLEKRQHSERTAAFEKFLKKAAISPKKLLVKDRDKLSQSMIKETVKEEKVLRKTNIEFNKTYIHFQTSYNSPIIRKTTFT